MIDSNGKLFGKVSIVDIFVVLAVIIAAGGIYVRFYGGPSKTIVQNSKFYYVIDVNNIRESNKDALIKNINGNFYLNEKITGEMGKLIKVDDGVAIAPVECADGNILMSEIPDRYNLKLTFEMVGKVNEKGYFSPSLEDISAGISYNIKGKYSEVSGTILEVWQ